MRFRTPVAVLAVAVCAGEAAAQPVAPPRRPTFSSYSNLYTPGGGFFGYGAGAGGFNPYGFGAGGGQQAALLQQLNQTNSAVANMQQFLAYGMNPMASPTGRGATFNNLSHWYPTYRGQGVPFAAQGGFGFGMPGGGGGGGGLMNTAMLGAATANAVGGAANAPRTAGNGIPVASPKR